MLARDQLRPKLIHQFPFEQEVRLDHNRITRALGTFGSPRLLEELVDMRSAPSKEPCIEPLQGPGRRTSLRQLTHVVESIEIAGPPTNHRQSDSPRIFPPNRATTFALDSAAMPDRAAIDLSQSSHLSKPMVGKLDHPVGST